MIYKDKNRLADVKSKFKKIMNSSSDSENTGLFSGQFRIFWALKIKNPAKGPGEIIQLL